MLKQLLMCGTRRGADKSVPGDRRAIPRPSEAAGMNTGSKVKPLVVAGVDLAGSPARPTGVCILTGDRARTQLAFDDAEILDIIRSADPELVPIDAPLSLPPGRRDIGDRNGEHFRPCDRELQRLGNPLLPDYPGADAHADRARAQAQGGDRGGRPGAGGVLPRRRPRCLGAAPATARPRRVAQGACPAGSQGAARLDERTRARRGRRGPGGTGFLQREPPR